MNCYFYEILMAICCTSDKMFISEKITSLVLVRISDDGGDVGFSSVCVNV